MDHDKPRFAAVAVAATPALSASPAEVVVAIGGTKAFAASIAEMTPSLRSRPATAVASPASAAVVCLGRQATPHVLLVHV